MERSRVNLILLIKRVLYYKWNKFITTTLFLLCVLTIIAGNAIAGEDDFYADSQDKAHSSGRYNLGFLKHEHLLDFEQRDILADKGLTLDLVFTGDFVTNHDGGIKTAGSGIDKSMSYLSNTDLTIKFDTEKAGLWNGGTLFSYIFYHDGVNPTADYIGDLQMVDNYEADDGLKVYELWYEHTFDLFGTDLSLLAGLHDLNGEFSVTEYGLLFVQSSFGFNAEIANNIPVANFPVAALGFRLKWDLTDSFYYRGEISDGDPGKDDCGLRHVSLSSKQGFVTFHELVYHFGDIEESNTMPGTFKLGGWYHSDEFDDVRDTDVNGEAIEHADNYGIYFIADQMLIPGDGDTGLGAFFQIGGVPDDRNEIDFYVGGGLHYKGLIPRREEDILGLAIAHARIGDDQRDAEDVVETDGSTFHSRDKHETVIELTYRAQLFPWLSIQPGVQTIFNPGANADLDNATVSILRFQIHF